MRCLTNEQLQSKTISFLRFPLIIGILFIHSQTSLAVVGGLLNTYTPIFDKVRDLCSFVLSAVSVPLFFLISGYLFFYNINFTKKVFVEKIKKRGRTLLTPYLYWNGIYLLFNIVVSYIPTFSSMFKGNSGPLSFANVISAMWNYTIGVEHVYPIAYQFWFIRDLMVMVILSPLHYIFIKQTKTYGIFCVAILWCWGYSIPYLGMRGMSSTAVFFYMLGAWFSINKKNLITESRKYKKLVFILYPLFVFADLYTMNEVYNVYIHNIGILFGLIYYLVFASNVIQRKSMPNLAFWSSASFFVFAIHDPWILTQLRKVAIILFSPATDASMLFFYFINILLTVIISVAIYMIIRRIFPRFTAVITGGRD